MNGSILLSSNDLDSIEQHEPNEVLNVATVQREDWPQPHRAHPEVAVHDHSPQTIQTKEDLPSPGPQSPFTLDSETRENLFSDAVYAKIWGVALRALRSPAPPVTHPEYTIPGGTKYIHSSKSFWTSGFFPGCLALMYERQRKWPLKASNRPHTLALQHAMRWWYASLHEESSRCDTHDLGFMIQPWAELGWHLDGDRQCLISLVSAAENLASRFDPKVGCIRSWDTCVTRKYSFTDTSKDFLVIIDNMMNLDLLYHVAGLNGDQKMAEIATIHALTSMQSHIRDDSSTCHVVNFDPATGAVKGQLTNQGYSDTSCWTRGQAWGIAGFAQVYHRTHDKRFLDTSRRLADYYLARLPADSIPPWDFDAPDSHIKDTSAALVAVYGMLLIHEADLLNHATNALGGYLQGAMKCLAAITSVCLSPKATFVTTSSGEDAVDMGSGLETLVMHATINNFEYAPRRWADHGLVYADYFFLLIGNKLLHMGIV